MYRQHTSQVNSIKHIYDSLINPDLMKFIRDENILIKEEEERQKERLNTLQLKFIYNDKIANVFEKKNKYN